MKPISPPQLVDALRSICTCQVPLSEAVMYFAVKLYPEARGVESANSGIYIQDMLAHYTDVLHPHKRQRKTIRRSNGMRMPWTGYLRPKS